MSKLNATQVKNLKPTEMDYSVADGDGLVLQVTHKGTKRWRFRYRWQGRQQMLSLGIYPDVSLADAREALREARSLLAKGLNPSTERIRLKAEVSAQVQAEQNTFNKAAKEYFNLFESNVSEKHYKKQWGRLEKNIFPYIGDECITDITKDQIFECVIRIQGRGAIEEGHRVLNLVRLVFDYAIAKKYCPHNVARDVVKRHELIPMTNRNYPTILEPTEIGKLLRAIDGYIGGEPSVRCALKLMPFIGLRPNNIRTMEWNELDLQSGKYVIPKSKMKMKREHWVPLPRQAIAILKELQPLTGGGQYVFTTSRHKNTPISENTLNAALIRLGYSNEEIVPHGFRAMFSTLANENIDEGDKHGISSAVIEKHLAHEKGKVEGAYNRAEYWEQRVKLLQWWADYLEGLKHGD